MESPKKEIIDEIFQGLDLDYSEFKESSEMAIFIAGFIAVNVKKGISLELVHHSWSGHHSLRVSGKKDILVTFRGKVGQYDIKNVYAEDELIITTCDQEKYFYYIHELIKNVTFSNYLIKDDKSYHNATKLTDKTVCSLLNNYRIDNPNFLFGTPSFEDTGMVYRFTPYCIFVSIKSLIDEHQFCFSGGLSDPDAVRPEFHYFNSFHDLICYMNKYIYDNVVKPVIDVPANEFQVEHKTLIQMIDI